MLNFVQRPFECSTARRLECRQGAQAAKPPKSEFACIPNSLPFASRRTSDYTRFT